MKCSTNTNNDLTLWHYTNRESTLGIIGNKCLWATSILYLNDSAEFHHVRHLIAKWIKRTHTENTLGAPKNSRLLSGRESVYVRFLERQLTGLKVLNTFVISFSGLSDDLSQWRAYGMGGGFSLGFSPSVLQSLAKEQGFELVVCIYDDGRKEALVEDLMEAHLNEFRKIDATISDDDLTSGLGLYVDLQPSQQLRLLGDNFFLEAQRVASRIKSQAFAAEQEWRLISMAQPSTDAIRFRSSSSMLIPYCVFQLTSEEQNASLKHIIAGPSPHIELNLLAVTEMCRARQVICQGASKSSISYRYW